MAPLHSPSAAVTICFMPSYYFPLPALDTIPSATQLSHIHQDTEPPAPSQTNNIQLSQSQRSKASSMKLGGGIPPVPAKLVKRIQEGSFIEMAELLPELLRNASLPDDINKI